MARLGTCLSSDKPFGEIQPFIDYEKYTNLENEDDEDLIVVKKGDFIEIDCGRINLPFYSTKCNDTIIFKSNQNLHCLIISDKIFSIDCDLKCDNRNEQSQRCRECNCSVQSWFLIEADEIFSNSPNVNLIKISHKLSDELKLPIEVGDKYSEWFAKADIAYKERLGAGAAIYLRSIFENIIYQFGKLKNVERKFINKWGKEQYKSFEQYTEEVNELCKIIPEQYSKDKYKLFRELSNIAHGNEDEQIALEQFPYLRRLIVSIIDNIKRKDDELKDNKEIIETLITLGWNDGGETGE